MNKLHHKAKLTDEELSVISGVSHGKNHEKKLKIRDRWCFTKTDEFSEKF